MSSSAITGPVFSDVKRSPSGSAAAPSWSFNESTGTGIYLVSAGVLGLSTNGVQRVVVDASGNVGIGTASPETKLHISYGLATGDYISTGGTNRNQNGLNKIVKFKHGYWSGTQEVASIGVVTTSSTSGNGYGFGDLVFYTGSSGNGDIGSTSAERMRIDASGNLLVGTASALVSGPKIQVNETIAAWGIRCRTGTTGAFTGSSFVINWTGAPQLWIDTTNVGNITLTSDYRIKKNIETQEQPALERIAQLRPVKYEFANYGTLFKEDGVQREGFIAHELQAVIPSAVEGEKDAEEQIQSLKLDALCSVMVKAIQEQQEIIGKLEARLAALESK